MNRFSLWAVCISAFSFAQNISQKLDKSISNLLNTNEAYSANISFFVSDSKGNLIYEYQGNKGLSTASTQKIFSAGAALETLGSSYRYTTTVSYSGKVESGNVSGDIIITSNGDPTLGSWRYEGYKPEDFKQKLLSSLTQNNISKISGNIIIDDSWFDLQTIPGGWAWDDLGNYYGAGVWGVNWRENQFDLNIKGSEIQSTNIPLPNLHWASELKAKGSTDQSLIFTAPHSEVALINGNLPSGKLMTVSGATPNPPLSLGYEVKSWLKEAQISFSGEILTSSGEKFKGNASPLPSSSTKILEYYSPTLDKIVFWFLRKSVNLYGETFIKTIAKEKTGESNYKTGIALLKNFWASKAGIHKAMINFADGSGLSPQNYVSAKAEVQALLWAKKQNWFNAFYDALPTLNGMKMKSGTIRNTKSFAGYHNGYTFSIIINNYQGNNATEALYKVLNHLK